MDILRRRLTIAETVADDGLADLRAELDLLNGQIAPLQEQREELRIAAGRLIQQASRENTGSAEIEARRVQREMAGLDVQIGPLRQRRREVLRDLQAEKPAPMPPQLINVAMPKALADVQDRLNTARAARQALIRDDTGELSDKQRIAAIAHQEDEIRRLRQAREVALRPYDGAVVAALEPHLVQAAADIRASLATLFTALGVIDQAARSAPPPIPIWRPR